ncbi:hypothetical protein CVO96_16635 [Deinococcus koreensis]|uniref:Uncharacterized protein n=1 Tax=Deinococcus koreensis TaxID=2054903 RepID=A0A2K3UTP2_9DEIO|nr:hypothetical protein CVO96_16635 [Deinococcus koreensis]
MVCTAPRNSLVPHGVDNDILLGLVNAAILQGLPEDDTVRLTGRELLKLSGITPSARAYVNLHESLRRLQHTAYDVTDSWFDGLKQRWRSMSFSLIVKHWAEDNFKDVTNLGQWRAQTVLAIKLDDGLVKNIRAGHILPLDFELLSKLSQPLTRNLFRTLSFQRESGRDVPVLAYSVPLTVWAAHLGMHGLRLDTVLRSLKPAHEELVEVGFLKEVTFQGRGQARTVHYAFGTQGVMSADPETAALLARYGVSGGRSLILSQTHGQQAIQRAVSVLEALLQTSYRSKIRNRAGILMDIIESPERYDSILTREESSRAAAARAVLATSEPQTPERTAAAARVILVGQFDDTPVRRGLRDRAVNLYVSGHIRSLDLIGLLSATTDEAAANVAQWERAVLQV